MCCPSMSAIKISTPNHKFVVRGPRYPTPTTPRVVLLEILPGAVKGFRGQDLDHRHQQSAQKLVFGQLRKDQNFNKKIMKWMMLLT